MRRCTVLSDTKSSIKQGLLTSVPLALGWHKSVVWVHPVHCRVFSGFSGFYSLDAAGPSYQAWQPKIFPDIVRCSLGGKITPAENHCQKVIVINVL